jgi:hypothetical protein
MAKETMKPRQTAGIEAFQEEIRKLAGEYYRQRTAAKKPGDAFSDWLQAEKEVKKRHGL